MAKYELLKQEGRAKAWLEERGISYDLRDIKQNNPTVEELTAWYRKSGLPLKKFFNTSGLQYKALGLKDKLTAMQCLPDSLVGREYYHPTESGVRFPYKLLYVIRKEWAEMSTLSFIYKKTEYF